MDRVSGWYKRRAQIIILVLGFAIALALNADSVTLVKSLSTDKAVRESLVAAAEAYARDNSAENASGTNATTTRQNAPALTNSLTANSSNATTQTLRAKPSPTSSPRSSPTAGSSPSPRTSPASVPAASPAATLSPASSPKPSPTAASAPSSASSETATGGTAASPSASPSPTPEVCAKDPDSPQCKIAMNVQEIKKLDLPIGWLHGGDDKYREWPGSNWTGEGGWLDQFYWHLLGWLITALAVSLGAPFWFDLLNKFIVIRSTVKPHEKSPEEPSKQ